MKFIFLCGNQVRRKGVDIIERIRANKPADPEPANRDGELDIPTRKTPKCQPVRAFKAPKVNMDQIIERGVFISMLFT